MQVEFAEAAERDFELIFDHLVTSYVAVGEARVSALDRAVARVRAIRAAASRIATAPHRGERHDDLQTGLRHLTLDQAVYWFEVDDAAQTVRVLAVFFGGQDHVRHMTLRLLARGAG
jgi:plasmid stabilization system protein ParE